MTALQASAAITVRDDDGNAVTVEKPAQRIISMAPHVTELLFAAGGGERIVGAVSYSDFPEAAKRIPHIGDNRQVDMERVIAMKPDLIVVWIHGSSERQIETLRKLGILERCKVASRRASALQPKSCQLTAISVSVQWGGSACCSA